MIKKNAVVLYKNQPAVVSGIEQDKFVIQFYSFALTAETVSKIGTKGFLPQEQKVREKDIVLLSKCDSPEYIPLKDIVSFSDDSIEEKIKEARELFVSDFETAPDSGSAFSPVDFFDLIELIDSRYVHREVWFCYASLCACPEFSALPVKDSVQFVPRTDGEIAELLKKRDEKRFEKENRAAFIKRLKQKKLEAGDSVFMGDVEAFALGKTDRSKTLSEAGFSQDIEKAHRLLIDTGIWDVTRNPYPARWGLAVRSAKECLPSPPEEERLCVPGVAYAIDNLWSKDPDDAVAFDGTYVWVHIADPASAVMPDSDVDRCARERGATLYIPEGASRMLSEESLSDYALGLKKESFALSFRILLDEHFAVKECAVFKTRVFVECMTYEQADARKDSPELKPLFEIAKRNCERRTANGAVTVNLPEAHITVEPDTKKVSVQPVVEYESAALVREMMLLAGEGAAHFAFENQIPFPYVSQEAPELPQNVPGGLAGELKLVKSMKKRSVGVTPAVHSGLGIGMYSQVTSPLRRYSDLIAHQQLRAFLDGRGLLDKNAVLERVCAGDEAAIACKKVERKSSLHWTLVYLLQNPVWTGEAVLVEKKGTQGLFLIPSIAQQTTLVLPRNLELNDSIIVRAAKIDIPSQTVLFVEADG